VVRRGIGSRNFVIRNLAYRIESLFSRTPKTWWKKKRERQGSSSCIVDLGADTVPRAASPVWCFVSMGCAAPCRETDDPSSLSRTFNWKFAEIPNFLCNGQTLLFCTFWMSLRMDGGDCAMVECHRRLTAHAVSRALAMEQASLRGPF